MPLFQFNESSIYYQISGVGEPVVLLHGFLEDSSIFHTIIPELHAHHFQTIVIDLPGHGKSTFDKNYCSMPFMADSINALLNSLNLNPTFIVGHSMGGYVALSLCNLRKHLKIVLLHSNFWADSELKQADRNRVIDVVVKNKNLFIQEAIPNLFAPGNKIIFHQEILVLIDQAKKMNASNIIASTQGMRDREHHYNFAETNVIAIIQGNDDPIISNQILEAELAKIQNKPKVFYIQNCGHMGFIEKPNEIINCLTQVLIQ